MNKRKKFLRGFFAIFMALAIGAVANLGGIFAKSSSALDDGVSLTVSPVISRIEISAGEPQDGTFNVINNGTVDYDVNIYASPYSVVNETYGQNFSDTNNKFSQIYRWITVDEANFSLKSGETKAVNYHINPPASIPDGSQYGVIFAQTKQKTDMKTSGVMAESRVGMLVFAKSANGETINDGKIVESSLGKLVVQDNAPTFAKKAGNLYDAAPVAVLTSIKNSGNTDFQITSESKMEGILWGGTIKSGKTSRTVLPDTTFQTTDVLCNDGKNDLASDETTGAPHCASLPFAGIFNVTTTVNMLGKNYDYKHFVIIFPLWLLVAIIAVILLIAGLIFAKIHWKSSKKSAGKKMKLNR